MVYMIKNGRTSIICKNIGFFFTFFIYRKIVNGKSIKMKLKIIIFSLYIDDFSIQF